LVALQFLTTIPVPIKREIKLEEYGRSVAYFPLVGLLLGLLLAGLDYLLRFVFPLELVNALLIVALIGLSGALHLDGFLDTCDGVFSFKPPQVRLEIMKDSRVGSYGVVGGVALLLVKFAALLAVPLELRPFALVLMPVFGRWAIVFAAVVFPYARPESSLGRLYKEHAGRGALLIATISTVVIAGVVFQLGGLAMLAAIALVSGLMILYIMTKIPGMTGDTYGAINEVMEVVALLLFPIYVRIIG
jgi:adenosylcobinamide-GDP ribazoletransferase